MNGNPPDLVPISLTHFTLILILLYFMGVFIEKYLVTIGFSLSGFRLLFIIRS